MYKGKRHNSFRAGGKYIALLASLVLVITAVVGGTVAYLMQTTDPITNVFDPSEVTTQVTEDLVDNVKTNVKIKNTGDTEAYIRAAVVITWQDAEGNVHHQKPVAGTDYSIDYNKTDWTLANDGCWYHKAPVAADSSTATLIVSCSPIANKAPAGYGLTVEILSSGIQSVPTKVVEEQWGAAVAADGTISK